MSCPVCLGSLVNPYVTGCDHAFCARCLFTIIQSSTSRSCPSCRSPLKICTPQGSHIQDDHIKLNVLGVAVHVVPSSTSSLTCLFGISDRIHHLKLIYHGKLIHHEDSNALIELAKKKATLLLLLSTPLAQSKGPPGAILEAVLKRLRPLLSLMIALLTKLLAPIWPPLKLFFDSLMPGFDPKKLKKKTDHNRQ